MTDSSSHPKTDRRRFMKGAAAAAGIAVAAGFTSTAAHAASRAGQQESVITVDPTIRPGVSQSDWDNDFFKKRASKAPSVDQHLIDPALVGAVDLHAHGSPDPYPRQWDIFEIAKICKDRGMRALVFKNHYAETAGYAYLTRKYGTQGIEVFGALAFDLSIGGVNPQAIRYMVSVPGNYGRIVWMPTHDAEYEVKYRKEGRPFVRVAKDGQLVPEVLESLDLIAQNDLTLATGHVGPEEALLIMHEAKKRGVQRIIMTHPLASSPAHNMTIDQLKEGTSLGAFFEITWGFDGPTPEQKTRFLDAARQIGPNSTFVSSDAGLQGGLNHGDCLALAAKAFREAGFTEPELNKMFKQNPAQLIKLPIS
jgi:hypothetical protein